MDTGALYGRGVAFPPRVDPEGGIAWSAGPDHVREAIRVVLLTEPGERLQLPEFGSRLRGLLGEPNTVATRRLARQHIERALADWEPRIELDAVTVEPDGADPAAALATIRYRLLATGAAGEAALRVRFSA